MCCSLSVTRIEFNNTNENPLNYFADRQKCSFLLFGIISLEMLYVLGCSTGGWTFATSNHSVFIIHIFDSSFTIPPENKLPNLHVLPWRWYFQLVFCHSYFASPKRKFWAPLTSSTFFMCLLCHLQQDYGMAILEQYFSSGKTSLKVIQRPVDREFENITW